MSSLSLPCDIQRTVYGIGYVGQGKYSARANGKKTDAYASWFRMFQRCYSKPTQDRQGSYIGCSVAIEWHNFQNFAEWFYSQPNSARKGFDLDKDLVIGGNKVYGPNKCSFVPAEINRLLIHRGNPKYDLPRGVTMCRGKYRAAIFYNKKPKFLGDFDKLEDACNAYAIEKERVVKELANRFISDIDENVYNFLLKWKAH